MLGADPWVLSLFFLLQSFGLPCITRPYSTLVCPCACSDKMDAVNLALIFLFIFSFFFISNLLVIKIRKKKEKKKRTFSGYDYFPVGGYVHGHVCP